MQFATLTEQEVQQIISQESNKRNSLLILWLYHSSVRISEVCRLVWGDFYQSGGRYFVKVLGKGNILRDVELSFNIWVEMHNFKPFDACDNDPVFLSRCHKGSKKGLKESQIRRIVTKAAERIGLKGVSPHWLRHCGATHSHDNGAHITAVAQTLGHKRISFSMTYVHSEIDPNDGSSLYLPDIPLF